jgi:maltose-binding protein MalE
MKAKNLSRRDFLRLTVLTAGGAVLASCAPAAPTAAPAAAPTSAPAVVQPTVAPPAPAGVTVNFWPSWGNFAPVWDKFKTTQEFKDAAGPNTFEIKTGTPTEGLLAAIAAGTPPDGASNVQYLDLMARGVLRPIDDMVATSKIIKKDSYLEGSWKDAFYKNTMYGVPGIEGFIRYGLNYNSKMVTDAGLDPAAPPQTWDECLEWHKKLTKFDAAGNLVQIGLDPYDAMGGQIGIQDGFYPPVSWGWTWFDAATGKFDLANAKMAESFDVMGEFYRIAGPDKIAGMRSVEGQGGWGGSFNASVQAMIIEGYWHPGETIIQKPDVGKLNMATWAPVPAARKGTKVQGTGGHYVVLFKDAKYTSEMFKMSEFFNSDTACNLIFTDVGWLPGLKAFIAKTDPSAYPGLKFYFDSVTQATEWSSPARCPITNFVSTQYQELREKVFRDQMKSADAATEFQTRCENEWKAQGLS